MVVTDECTVRFESNGGTSVPDQKVKLGQKVTRPEDPTKEGFALAGWYSDFDMTREWDFDKDTVQGSMTLYAKWVDASQLPSQGFHMPLWGWLALGAVLLAVLLLLLLRHGHRQPQGQARREADPASRPGKGGLWLRRLVSRYRLHKALGL